MKTPSLSAMALLIAMMAAFTGCDVHEFPSVIPEPEPPVEKKAVLHLMLDTDEMDYYQTITVGDGAKSRGVEDDTHSLRYIVRAYTVDEARRSGSRAVIECYDGTVPKDDSHTSLRIPLSLAAGTYDIAAWVEHVPAGTVGDYYHDTSDFYEIPLAGVTAATSYTHRANNDNRIAWRGMTRITVDSDGAVYTADSPEKETEVVEMQLKSPMARYHFITTDLDEFISRHAATGPSVDHAPGIGAPAAPNLDDYRVVVRYTGYMPCSYSVFTDKPVDSRLGVSYEGKLSSIDGKSTQLGFDHVFVNGSATSVQVSLELYRRRDNALLSSSGVIDVPLIRGRYTLVTGAFLTTSSGASMGINPGFNGEFNIEIK